MSRRIIFLSLIVLTQVLSACAVNPVTGANQINFYSRDQDIAIGGQQYVPSQQSQGGLYLVNPELQGYVNQVGQRLAEQAARDYDLPYEFVVLNNSVPNAWALPGGKIAVNRGLLLELNNEAELAAVLGHEVVHAAARHGTSAMSRGVLLQGALMVGAIAGQDNAYNDYIVGAGMLGAQLVSLRYGRENELESDEQGIQYMVLAGYDPNAAVSLQETFVRLSEGNNPGWLQGLFASHPPSQERVENNRAKVNELMPIIAGADLEIGEQRYQQAIASLRANQEAYDLFDEAQSAIADDDLEIALLNLNEASEMVPAEARFTGLEADIYLYQNRYQDAVSTYSEAIQKDGMYFDYYLGRGVAYARLGDRSRAQSDLERSNELLPTATAMNELGKIALANNDRNQAKEYFQTAAGGGGSVASEAAAAFVRLDVVDNPQNYIQAQVFIDNNGTVLARVVNRAGVPLQDVQLEFTAVLNAQIAQEVRTIGSLNQDQTVDVSSGLRFPEGVTPGPNQMQVRVVSARPR